MSTDWKFSFASKQLNVDGEREPSSSQRSTDSGWLLDISYEW